jgi:hypothetical protein
MQVLPFQNRSQLGLCRSSRAEITITIVPLIIGFAPSYPSVQISKEGVSLTASRNRGFMCCGVVCMLGFHVK